jgi:hypothetical protein
MSSHVNLAARYRGTGAGQMGLRIEHVSVHDGGNWTLRIRHDKEWIETTFEVLVTDLHKRVSPNTTAILLPRLTTDVSLPIHVEVRIQGRLLPLLRRTALLK